MKQIIKYFFVIYCTLSLPKGYSQDATIDSLKLALKNAKHDTSRCNILFTLIEAEGDDNIWPQYNEQLKLLAEKNITHGSLLNKFYWKYLGVSLNNIGFLANSQGDISKSLDYFHRSLKIQEEIKDIAGMAESLNNLGAVYKKQGSIKRALECYHQGLAMNEEIGRKTGIATALNNIAGIYDTRGEISKALVYYQKSLKITEELADQSGIALAFNNIGYIYNQLGDVSKSLSYFQRSLKIQEEIGDKSGIITSLCNIAIVMTENGKAQQAFSFADKALQTSIALGFPELIKNTASTVKKIFQKQNKYKEAFEMYELEIKMRDSINNDETRKASLKKQMQYDYDKKELLAKAAQDKKDIIAAEELKQKENERNYFIGGFGLVILLALFILRGYKQKQKANKLITQQKHLVEEKQKEILDSIHYAKRIQTALMANENYIEKSLHRLSKQ